MASYKNTSESSDTQLLADGCTALFQLVFGIDNWYRWNNIKQQTQLGNLQSFISWMLDVAEQEIKKPINEMSSRNVTVENYANDFVEYSEVNKGYNSSTREVSVSRHDGVADTFCNTEVYHTDDSEVIMIDSGEENLKQEEYEQEFTHTSTCHEDMFQQSTPSTSKASVHSPQALNGAAGDIVFDCKLFFCNSCQVSLSDIEVVREHVNLRHEEQYGSIGCYCCNQMFLSIQGFIDFHRMNATINAASNKAKINICNYCAKGFKQKRDLEDHIANKHLKMGPRHECPGCFKKFSHANNLRIHKKKCITPVAQVAQ